MIKCEKISKRLHIKDFKNSSIITTILLLFIFLSTIAYFVIRDNIVVGNEKDRKILFYEIQTKTSELLSKLIYRHSIQKSVLLEKHELVKEYLEAISINPLEANLTVLQKLIDTEKKNYHIYVADSNLVIKNSTLKKDIGFDLSFAKDSFNKHYEENVTGVCSPLYEQNSQQFISYADSYIKEGSNDKAYLLQVSYTYKDKEIVMLEELRKMIVKYPYVVEAKAYISVDTGFFNAFNLQGTPSKKMNLKEMLSNIKAGYKLNDKLNDRNLNIETFEKNNVNYTAMYLSTKSSIFDNTKVIYSILLDNSELDTRIKRVNFYMALVVLLGVIAIFITFNLRKKEIKLTEQDKFVQSSMHEIKTPLSIITLNNELRELEFGKDEYSSEIDSAIKTLKTSYEDMSFTMTKSKLDYPVEILSLGEILQDRVEYFTAIAKVNSKSIILEIRSDCNIKISKVELIRLIDNNLSNAVKYADMNSTIKVTLDNNSLSFHNAGKPIKDIQRIFDKYFRENIVVGGHGLGLSIVNDIANKYKIDISLDSDELKGTTFKYKFKRYSNDV